MSASIVVAWEAEPSLAMRVGLPKRWARGSVRPLLALFAARYEARHGVRLDCERLVARSRGAAGPAHGARGALAALLAELGEGGVVAIESRGCLLYTSPSPRDGLLSRMPSSA